MSKAAAAVRVNMSNVGSGFELMENGQYLANFAKYDARRSPNSGNMYFNLEFHIDGDKHPQAANRRQWGTLSAQPQSMWAFKEFLLAMGYPQDELDKDDGQPAETMSETELVAALSGLLEQVKGGKVLLDVVTEPYQKRLPDGTTVEEQSNRIGGYTSIYS